MNIRFIAEMSSNHGQQLDRCLQLIDCAAEMGCDGVKFQLFKIDQLFAPEILERSAVHAARRDWELPESYLPAIKDRCRARNVSLGCTPFYLDGVAALRPYVDFYKISSYELPWCELLASCAKTGLPMVLSTGMATMSEVTAAVSAIRAAGNRDLTVLHCVSAYPSRAAGSNLAAIETLRQALACAVGWSDHSCDPGVIYRAVNRFGASMIEFHLDLDGHGIEYGGGHCWLPSQMSTVIRHIRSGIAADGDGHKAPTAVESNERSWRADPADGLRPLRGLR